MATEHLIGHGHRRIGLHGRTDRVAAELGPSGGLPPRPGRLRPALRGVAGRARRLELDPAARRRARLLDQPEPPTAIFVANDIMAAGTIDAARERGLSPPADLALVGYDGREMSRYLRPALTTVTKPTYELGRAAASLLVEQVMKLSGSPTAIAVRGRLLYRASCGSHSIEPEPLGEQDPYECRAPADAGQPAEQRAMTSPDEGRRDRRLRCLGPSLVRRHPGAPAGRRSFRTRRTSRRARIGRLCPGPHTLVTAMAPRVATRGARGEVEGGGEAPVRLSFFDGWAPPARDAN